MLLQREKQNVEMLVKEMKENCQKLTTESKEKSEKIAGCEKTVSIFHISVTPFREIMFSFATNTCAHNINFAHNSYMY